MTWLVFAGLIPGKQGPAGGGGRSWVPGVGCRAYRPPCGLQASLQLLSHSLSSCAPLRARAIADCLWMEPVGCGQGEGPARALCWALGSSLPVPDCRRRAGHQVWALLMGGWGSTQVCCQDPAQGCLGEGTEPRAPEWEWMILYSPDLCLLGCEGCLQPHVTQSRVAGLATVLPPSTPALLSPSSGERVSMGCDLIFPACGEAAPSPLTEDPDSFLPSTCPVWAVLPGD